jgi:hypothetical protein
VCVNDGKGGQTCFNLNDSQYQQLYNRQNGNQGIKLPFGAPGGAITCGGAVCGSATYFESWGSMGRSSASIGIGIVGGKMAEPLLARVFGWVAGLFGRTAATTAASTASGLMAGKVLTGFSAEEVQMVERALQALEAAGYNTGRLTELVKADFRGIKAGMSLGENGAALANEAFESQAMLNHVLEEELIHTQQAARGLSAGDGPGAADALEAEVDAIRKFPDPRNK